MKASGSYESVVLGVSQQVPQDRRSGQMWEQVNMISDPVKGVVRRQGSQFMAEAHLDGLDAGHSDFTADAARYNTTLYTCDGNDYMLTYAVTRRVQARWPALACFGLDTKKALPVTANGPLYDLLDTYGVSSAVNLGKFVLLSVNGYNTEYHLRQVMPGLDQAKAGAVWIRQGNFSRTYALTLIKPDGSRVRVEYKTPSASYPGSLDTSDIIMPIPPQATGNDSPSNEELTKYQKDLAEYNRLVTERTQAYNSAVTSWIGESTAKIQPENIAQELINDSIAKGITGIYRMGNYLAIQEESGIANIVQDDGGDDTYMRTVIDTVDSVDRLSPKHWEGKVMRVSSKKYDNKDSYFLKAFRKTNDGESFTDVVWREAAGEETVATSLFCIGYVWEDRLYVGGTPAELNAICPAADCPPLEPSSVGDKFSSPAPTFYGKTINYLGVFQDRLLVGTGAVIFASRPGDYFNFFRQSVLSVEDNDPIEMFALGAEDDVIRWDATFDRNLVMFGRKHQYLIPGRTMMSAKSPFIQIMSSIEDAVNLEPKSSGSYVFYGKDNQKRGSLHQIQLGAVSDSSDSYEITQALDTYLKGQPVQIVTVQAPNNVVVRTNNNPYGLYVYTYLQDMNGGERVFDSWSRWEWSKLLGPSVGMIKDLDTLYVLTARPSDTGTTFVWDMFNFDTEMAEQGYFDSWYPMASRPDWAVGQDESQFSAVYNANSQYYLLGSRLDKVGENIVDDGEGNLNLVVGANNRAWVTPTSPYMRDTKDKAITTGRLTLGSFKVSVSSTGGLGGLLITRDRETEMIDYSARLLTRKSNMVGRAPIVEGSVSVPVFREIRDFKCELHADSWLPLTVTGLEWVGQWFNNTQRV